MIGKNIDLIAITVLLAGVALYSEARRVSVIEVVPHQRIALSQAVRRAFQCSHSATIPRAPRVTRTVAIAEIPAAAAPE